MEMRVERKCDDLRNTRSRAMTRCTCCVVALIFELTVGYFGEKRAFFWRNPSQRAEDSVANPASLPHGAQGLSLCVLLGTIVCERGQCNKVGETVGKRGARRVNAR